MGQKIALVVGNDIYPEPYRSLANATTDAGRVAGFLEQRLRFDVTPLNNRSASEVMLSLSSLVEKLTDDSQFFFYFAGHGLCVGDSKDQSLLCSDASDLLLDGVVSAPGAISPAALAAISRRGRGDMFFCLDVCRTQTLQQMGGPEIQRGGKGLRDAAAYPNGMKGTVQGRRLVLSSCADGQGAFDDGSFAKALLEEMGRLLDGGYELELGYDLVKMVTKRLKFGQTPELSGTPFILVPGICKPVDEPLQPPVSPGKTPLQLTTEANAALKAERCEDAERLVREALRIDPSFEWARIVLKRAQEQLKTVGEKEERNRELDQIVIEGWRLFKSDDSETALKKAEFVLNERPNDEGARELKRFSEEAFLSKLLTLWRESPSREAGFLRMMKIGDAEYDFRWIPAGEFDMGSPAEEWPRYDDEVLHHVKLTHGFWFLETPTTQALYKEVMGTNPSEFKGDDLPVETVSWGDAMRFCQELTKRLPKGMTASLPTEAQWEYACRAGTRTAYWYGDEDDPNNMNYHTFNASIEKTTPVKTYPANPWGLYDMHGNVGEWTLDHYGNYPKETVVDPRGPESAPPVYRSYGGWDYSGARIEPTTDPDSVFDRVCRGGGWNYYSGRGGSATRHRLRPDAKLDYVGFRFLLSCD